MGFKEGAANGLRIRLENVGVGSEIAVAIGQVAYLPRRKILDWIPAAVVPKSEITWLVSRYERKLAEIPAGIMSTEIVKELCDRVFGVESDKIFALCYPDYAEKSPAEKLAEQLEALFPDSDSEEQIDTSCFNEALLSSDLYWDGQSWVSSSEVGPGTDEDKTEAFHTSLITSIRFAALCTDHFKKTRVVGDPNSFNEISMSCRVNGKSGHPIDGFLVISDGRMGFFTQQAIFEPYGDHIAPVIFNVEDVKDSFCGLDECLIPFAKKWEKIKAFDRKGDFSLGLKLYDGRAYVFNIPPEIVLNNLHRSRLSAADVFLRTFDNLLSTASTR